MVGDGGVESDYSVCPCPLLQFLQFLQCQTGYFRLRRLHQVTSVYVGGTGRGARQYTDTENTITHYTKQLNKCNNTYTMLKLTKKCISKKQFAQILLI